VNTRTVLSIANIAAIVVALLVLVEFPQYSSYAFYALLAWIFLSMALAFSRRSRPVPRGTPGGGMGGTPGGDLSGTFASSASRPLPSAPSGGSRPSIDFCIYCGTTLPSGTTVCPACGHGIAAI